ncbi:right-handed parallel beta-helix repeat-containing protein [Pontiella sulfatireligans]|uniref:Right handed beta helix domain-containing protein n=1 Tax=Pontiella sulfatireligans TaxID=2750658 RepID=A0A6C2UHM2_9BACT|nr:right-handed parallel beta-helix repeat-containing protein [Pontiella sulfatireligans]VGO19628.1 hypothetical protein SCARR_01687 [Pontiella sulfatireligans]
MKRLFCIAVLGISSVASGTDYYVATNGIDTLPGGTLGSPFATIQFGVDQLTAGDALQVRGGRYHEAVSISSLGGSGGGSIDWSGGTGWNGSWALGADTSSAQSGGNTAAQMLRDGSITRTLATGVAGGTLSFKWDVDALNNSSEVAYAEVYDGSWHSVWSVNDAANGGGSGDTPNGYPDHLSAENVSLAAYGTVTQIRFRLSASGLGDYFFIDDVQLGAASHDFEGAAGAGITIQSYQDEVVMIDGTVPVSSGWTAVSNGIYKATFFADIWQLFVDDEMQTSARWPDAEAWTDAAWDKDANWIQQDSSSSDGIFIDESGGQELAGSGKDFSGAIAIMNTGSWLSFARTVASHGAGNNSFSYTPIGSQYHHKIINGAAFFEASYACLSTNKEWYYNPASDELFLISNDGLSPAGRNIRGKTITYGLEISNSQDITIQGIDFFACTFKVSNSDSITLEDSNVRFPSYSKRMLGDTAKADATYMDGNSNTLLNCTFQYADGAGIEFVGDGGLIENCLFYQIDYSCVGSLHDVMVNIRNASNLTFRHNTLDTGGNSVGIKGGDSSIFELNRVTNQGMLQHDGSAIQTDADYTDGTVMKNNWVHDHIKFALRFDSPWENPAVYGINGVMKYNVLWNTQPMVPKGDYHHIYGNTGFDNDVVDISIFSDITHGGINSNTVTRNNAVNLISGSRSAAAPYPGISDHNWSGGEVKNELVDPGQLDFRPAPGSALIDAGTNMPAQVADFVGVAPDVGAYEFGHTNYWIPGFISAEASMPIPNRGSVDQPEGRELIFQPGYEAVSVNVYFGSDSNSLPMLGSFPALHNVIDPRDHGVTPLGGTEYFWRIDTVLTDSSEVAGEVWSYTTASFTPSIPGVVFFDDFEAYAVGVSPPSSNWATQVALGGGTIQVFDMAGDNVVRLDNASSADDRTVLGTVDIFVEQGLITISFDSYLDGATPINGPLSLSAGVATCSSGKNQVRKVGVDSHSTTHSWQHFDWIVNQSGSAVDYWVDGASYSVAAGSADLWCDGTRVVDNGTSVPTDTEQTDTTPMDSFGWTVNKTDAADWRIDDVVVRNHAYAWAPPASPFDDWMVLYSVSGATNDPDGDGIDNLREFGLGGDPTNASLTGHATNFQNFDGGSEYVYPRRKDSGLDYWLETSTNLVSNVWTNSGYTELPMVGIIDTYFESITNQIPTALEKTFIRLRIEE